MARGYSQARAETPIARNPNYVKSSRIEPDDYAKKLVQDAIKDGAVTPKAAELQRKYGSGDLMDMDNADIGISKNATNRGHFMRKYYNGPELTNTFGKDFFKTGWTDVKSEVKPGANISFKNLGGDIYFRVGGIPTTHSFKAEELSENGGQFESIKDAIEWSLALQKARDVREAEGMERWIASGGSLD
jgi:hypothetical protein